MEQEVVEAEMVLPTHMSFKKIQMYEKYPKGQARARWKHLKQIIQAENYQNYPPHEPNYEHLDKPGSCLACCFEEMEQIYHTVEDEGPYVILVFISAASSVTFEGPLFLYHRADTKWISIGSSQYVNIESPPPMRPCKRICDITGYEAPYFDPRTRLRYANAEVFKVIRSLPNDYVQRYLALRNAAVVLR